MHQNKNKSHSKKLNIMNSFPTINKLFAALPVLLMIFIFSSCEKSDKYIDWKVINDDWYEAHKNDLDSISESGLCFRRISPEANIKERKPYSGDIVELTYTGTYFDGTQFDKGENVEMILQGTVPGFQEAVLKMREGETWEFYIPYHIGYGSRSNGAIPSYSHLRFEITLVSSRARWIQ